MDASSKSPLLWVAAATALSASLLWLRDGPTSGATFRELRAPSFDSAVEPARKPRVRTLAAIVQPKRPTQAPARPRPEATAEPDLQELEARMEQGGAAGAKAAVEWAHFAESQGDAQRAAELFDDGVRRWADVSGERSSQRASAILERGEFEFRHRKLEDALASVELAMTSVEDFEAWPERLRAMYAKASILRQLGRASKALQEVERAAAADREPPAPEYLDLHGTLLVETGKLDEAVAHYERAAAGVDPSNPPDEPSRIRFVVGRAEALVDLGRFEEAIEPLETVLAAMAEAEAGASTSALRPRVEFALAQALRETGGDDARVRALANSAREAWKGRTDQVSLDRLGRLEAFLGL